MIKWFKAQSPTVKGMIILCLLMIIGIILRWGYIKEEVGLSMEGLFSKPATQQTGTE